MLLLASAALLRGRGAAVRDAAPPPSIVFVLIDTLRPDFLGAYGFAGDVSPHLDALARESVLFERAFAQAPWTKPSIASLFTSLHPETHRVLRHRGRYADADGEAETTEALADEAVTLAEALRDAGYATAAFVANPWLLAEHGFGQGFSTYEQRADAPPMAAHGMIRRARLWLAERDPRQPFFLYLHLMDVHGPYRAPEADYQALRDSAGVGPSRRLGDVEIAQLRPYLLRTRWAERGDVRDVREWRARYAAGVRALDRQLGRFLADLRRDSVLDDAIVVIASDHGEELADDGGWDHGHALHDHQIHVPLLVRLPGGAGGGRRVADVVSLIDVMPTLLAAAGADLPDRAQGRDLSPLLRGEAAGDDASPASFASGVKWKPEMRSLRTEGWKLIEDGRAGTADLFDLTRDPHERTSVARERPHVAAELAGRLAEHRRALAAEPALAVREMEVPVEMKERLEALGYAE